MDLVPAVPDSALSLALVELAAGERLHVGGGGRDTFLFSTEGSVTVDGVDVAEATAAFVTASEELDVVAGDAGWKGFRAEVGPDCDEHAPLGRRERAVSVSTAASDAATGSRSFRILFGPHNGSCRATLFVGYVPPGRAPWHFHQYDEIVWVWRGDARFHHAGGSEDVPAGTAVRMRPRQVHVLENLSPSEELVIVGLFTPAGSPSAAYLAPDPTAQ